MPANFHGKVGLGSDQSSLIKDVPANCGGIGLDGLQMSFQFKLFYDSIILGPYIPLSHITHNK